MREVLAGQPGVQVVLGGGGQGAVAGGEPVQQRDRRSHVLLNDDDLGVGGVFGRCCVRAGGAAGARWRSGAAVPGVRDRRVRRWCR